MAGGAGVNIDADHQLILERRLRTTVPPVEELK
jgi:hypothetical protein